VTVADVRDVRRRYEADTVARMRWTRRGASRAELAELDLMPGERVLAVARTPQGAVVAASDRALHLPVAEHGHRRVGWELVDHAGWQDGWLRVRDTAGEAHRVRLPDPGSVPEAVQERVTATVVISSYAPLADAGGVRIVGRRAPGGDRLSWTFVFDSGLDPADPELCAQAERLLEDLRRQMGV
jgi:hypothetical protein